jgi:hypothetical protein
MKSEFSDIELKLKSPFCLTISGQSGAGKSTIIYNLIKNFNDFITPSPKSILYCYGVFNTQIPKIQKLGIQIHNGLPSQQQLDEAPKPLLLIFDDLMLTLNNKKDYLTTLVTRTSHHSNISIIFIVQNLFERNFKIVRDNSQYLLLMNSPSAALQTRTLGSQLFPGQNGLAYFLSAYKQAVDRKFGYLFIDLHPQSDALLRLRTNVFKETEFPTLFISL